MLFQSRAFISPSPPSLSPSFILSWSFVLVMLLLLLFLLSSAAGWFRSPKSRRLLSSWSTNRQSINRRHCPVQSSCLFLVCFLGPADCRRVASEREKWKKRNHSKKKILIGFQSCVSLFFLFFFSFLFIFISSFIYFYRGVFSALRRGLPRRRLQCCCCCFSLRAFSPALVCALFLLLYSLT